MRRGASTGGGAAGIPRATEVKIILQKTYRHTGGGARCFNYILCHASALGALELAHMHIEVRSQSMYQTPH
ncbi:hypothetical protein GCM10023352_13760 [Rothia endophytica]|uniref:Uncharacterized protein n=1 Tax=Rothia endophytica TaxID=1324766 RepID=A0ABP9BJ77_9MICC